MARRMLNPPPVIARTYAIPRSVLREAYHNNALHQAEIRGSLEKVRTLCHDLDLVTRPSQPIWRVMGIA